LTLQTAQPDTSILSLHDALPILPLLLMTTLIVAVGAYTAAHESAFLTQYNLGNLLLTAMPLALVSIGQTNALLVGGFDVSVAARSEEHTSELQSLRHLVCRLLLE